MHSPIVFSDPFAPRGRSFLQASSRTIRLDSLSPRSCAPSHAPLPQGALQPPAPSFGATCGREDAAGCHLALLRFVHTGATLADLVLETSHEGDAHSLAALLAVQAPTDARSCSAQTPLMLAIAAGSERCVDLLLRAGADVNAVDDSGTTALHLAAAVGDLCMLRRLCAVEGIALTKQLYTTEGYTPQQVAEFAQMPEAAAFLRARQSAHGQPSKKV